MTDRTHGALLDGRVRYAQPRTGYRTGIEPVLLAAAIPARPGDSVLEAGCGAGAGLLCLLWRVPGIAATGVEIVPEMAQLARANLVANGFSGLIRQGDVTADNPVDRVDHAFANPPWHDPGGTRPPDDRRATATHGAVLPSWIAALGAVARNTLTLALPAAQAGHARALMEAAGFGRCSALLLLPKNGRTPKIAVVQGCRDSAGIAVTTCLVLHHHDGRYTQEADAVLRHGAGLPLFSTGG